MRIGQRKYRQKGERPSATDAAAPANPDPVVMLVVSLLAASPVANDRILFANRASA
jgi:hypothetical protein